MTEVIVLKFLKDLPGDKAMIQKAPLSIDEARAWGETWKAETVYYWKGTQSAFIVKDD